MPKDFLSYEDLMLPRPPSRDEGDHLSDYEPSEIGGEEAPAAPAIFGIRSPELLSCSRSYPTPGLISRRLLVNPASV